MSSSKGSSVVIVSGGASAGVLSNSLRRVADRFRSAEAESGARANFEGRQVGRLGRSGKNSSAGFT